jgi:translocation and assembly module TamA
VRGLSEPLLGNVLAYLKLDEEPCDAPDWRIAAQYDAAPRDIRSALEAYGYYDPRIQGDLEATEDCWRAVFDIEAGDPVRIRSLDVALEGEAERDAAFAAVLGRSPLAVGAPLDHGAYERLKRGWTELARERGYAEAEFVENRIDVYAAARTADIVLHFDSGPRYDFGSIALEQNVLSEPLVRSYLPFAAGEPYDNRKLTDLYVALADSGYFAEIDIRSLEPQALENEIPIEIALSGAPRRLVSYGIGFSTDTGPRLRFSRNNRRYNDRGHQFGIEAQLSPVTSEVTANYRFPHGDPRTEWINFDTGMKRENTESSESESLQFGARRIMERPNDWTRTQLLNLLIEDFEVADQVGRSRLLMPGIGWRRTRADNEIRPQRGSRLSFEVRAAADQLGSDTSFLQAIAGGKWVWSLPSAARILVRAELGLTEERSFADLPPSVRFFAGGDNSVRGYDFEALGPTDADGKVVGGSSLVVGSIEYERPLVGRWALALFVDSGNAFADANFEPRTGAGLGVRWQSPLGPIRVDVAHPFDDPTTRWRLHVTLGPDL